ncbi:hypothetical protein LAUMK7_03383 [Mycobacterium kansasii]|uniref:Uncharacterized protein n=1 Tax=Mycobacterium kansasii TaxID=1768 RepID=A0A653EZN7_MYCKA|nr:hypothetical protein MKANGN_19510 [Mycobacterium kansasii]VAZ60963.1 hypothetical protein LAUMK22_02772 [Mycobacterium kansasii]VAZ67286.1 hypothetical protein LAUMK40_03425 [Mycobacterium kansasii]VAZ76468.1 hypothetical protein LAUMK7_03383 [Mycobacterium kansasii]VTP03004.1 hypothetical protein BIN_B_03735 [Mycobacterium kansasii]
MLERKAVTNFARLTGTLKASLIHPMKTATFT